MRPLRPSWRLGVGMGSVMASLMLLLLLGRAHGWVLAMFSVYAVAFYVLGTGIIEQERQRS